MTPKTKLTASSKILFASVDLMMAPSQTRGSSSLEILAGTQIVEMVPAGDKEGSPLSWFSPIDKTDEEGSWFQPNSGQRALLEVFKPKPANSPKTTTTPELPKATSPKENPGTERAPRSK